MPGYGAPYGQPARMGNMVGQQPRNPSGLNANRPAGPQPMKQPALAPPMGQPLPQPMPPQMGIPQPMMNQPAPQPPLDVRAILMALLGNRGRV